MEHSLVRLKNLGPVSVRQLKEVGIITEADLRQLGAVAAYRRLKHAFPRQVSLVMLYALAGALHDCHWNALPPGMKETLKAKAKG
jgi:DNA transformation protein